MGKISEKELALMADILLVGTEGRSTAAYKQVYGIITTLAKNYGISIGQNEFALQRCFFKSNGEMLYSDINSQNQELVQASKNIFSVIRGQNKESKEDFNELAQLNDNIYEKVRKASSFNPLRYTGVTSIEQIQKMLLQFKNKKFLPNLSDGSYQLPNDKASDEKATEKLIIDSFVAFCGCLGCPKTNNQIIFNDTKPLSVYIEYADKDKIDQDRLNGIKNTVRGMWNSPALAAALNSAGLTYTKFLNFDSVLEELEKTVGTTTPPGNNAGAGATVTGNGSSGGSGQPTASNSELRGASDFIRVEISGEEEIDVAAQIDKMKKSGGPGYTKYKNEWVDAVRNGPQNLPTVQDKNFTKITKISREANNKFASKFPKTVSELGSRINGERFIAINFDFPKDATEYKAFIEFPYAFMNVNHSLNIANIATDEKNELIFLKPVITEAVKYDNIKYSNLEFEEGKYGVELLFVRDTASGKYVGCVCTNEMYNAFIGSVPHKNFDELLKDFNSYGVCSSASSIMGDVKKNERSQNASGVSKKLSEQEAPKQFWGLVLSAATKISKYNKSSETNVRVSSVDSNGRVRLGQAANGQLYTKKEKTDALKNTQINTTYLSVRPFKNTPTSSLYLDDNNNSKFVATQATEQQTKNSGATIYAYFESESDAKNALQKLIESVTNNTPTVNKGMLSNQDVVIGECNNQSIRLEDYEVVEIRHGNGGDIYKGCRMVETVLSKYGIKTYVKSSKFGTEEGRGENV